jgi:hypothetical protein
MELARPTLLGHWGNATPALAVIAVALGPSAAVAEVVAFSQQKGAV